MSMRSAVLGAGLLAAAAASAHAQAVQLRFTPTVGQVTRYRTMNQMWMSGDTSAAPVVSTLYSTRTVMAMDGANYVVKTVMDSTITAMPGGGEGGRGGRPGMGGDMMRGMTITQHVDPRGRVLSSEVAPPPGLPPMVANMMRRTTGSGGDNNRSQAVMPEGPISPGATWTDSMISSSGGGRGQQRQVVFIVTYRFERVDREGGHRVAVISMNGSPQVGVTGTVTGQMAVDLDAGRLAHMETRTAIQSESGTTMRMQMTMETLP